MCCCLAVVPQEAGRPIRYPAKIAPSLKELMAGVDTVLAALTDSLRQHMGTASKQLHVQVSSGTKQQLRTKSVDRQEMLTAPQQAA